MIDELFHYAFMRMALVAGLLVALAGGYFGSFLVQRRMSFMGSGLAHASFAGIAWALLMGLDPLLCGAVFTVFVALGMKLLQERSDLASDTAIGVFFSGSMAAGIVCLALRRDATADAFSYLFGDILLLRAEDVWAAGAVAVLALLSLPLWGRWAYATFDAELAATDGVATRRDDYLLHIAIALTIVVAVKIVGIVLVAAFLVVPPAAARLVARTFAGMTLLSMLIGATSVIVGLILSYYNDLPSGAVIVLLQCALLLAVLPMRRA